MKLVETNDISHSKTRTCTNKGCGRDQVWHDHRWVCGPDCCQCPRSDGIAARMAAAMALPSRPVAM